LAAAATAAAGNDDADEERALKWQETRSRATIEQYRVHGRGRTVVNYNVVAAINRMTGELGIGRGRLPCPLWASSQHLK
jgi:hypothetical protein